MAELEPSKLVTRVRFPSPAPPSSKPGGCVRPSPLPYRRRVTWPALGSRWSSRRRSAWTPSRPSRTSVILRPGTSWRPDRGHHPAAEGRIRGRTPGRWEPHRLAPLTSSTATSHWRARRPQPGTERFLTRLPAVTPGPVADVLPPVEFAKSCSPRRRGLRMPDQSIHPAASQDTWPAPAP